MVHYPSYCSKYNPIEHRCFSQIASARQGVPFDNILFVKELTDTTNTSNGLSVFSHINTKKYLLKPPVNSEFKTNLDNYIPLMINCLNGIT